MEISSDERVQASALLVPGIVDIVLCQPIAEGAGQQASRRIVGHGRDVIVRAAHVGGKHVVVIASGHNFAVGVFHGFGQVRIALALDIKRIIEKMVAITVFVLGSL